MAEAAGAFWRRAVDALAHAFDGAREADERDTVFQTREARKRSEARAATYEDAREPNRPSKETLQ